MSVATPSRYQIRPFSRRVNRQIRNAHADYRQRIRVAIDDLAVNPRPPGSRQVSVDIRRIRVGPYRFIYHIDDVTRVVTVGKVERRGEGTYRDIRRSF